MLITGIVLTSNFSHNEATRDRKHIPLVNRNARFVPFIILTLTALLREQIRSRELKFEHVMCVPMPRHDAIVKEAEVVKRYHVPIDHYPSHNRA